MKFFFVFVNILSDFNNKLPNYTFCSDRFQQLSKNSVRRPIIGYNEFEKLLSPEQFER